MHLRLPRGTGVVVAAMALVMSGAMFAESQSLTQKVIVKLGLTLKIPDGWYLLPSQSVESAASQLLGKTPPKHSETLLTVSELPFGTRDNFAIVVRRIMLPVAELIEAGGPSIGSMPEDRQQALVLKMVIETSWEELKKHASEFTVLQPPSKYVFGGRQWVVAKCRYTMSAGPKLVTVVSEQYMTLIDSTALEMTATTSPEKFETLATIPRAIAESIVIEEGAL